jgi:hypothetical protein
MELTLHEEENGEPHRCTQSRPADIFVSNSLEGDTHDLMVKKQKKIGNRI